MAKKLASTGRQDAVLIRKSSDAQDERSQIENVERELNKMGVKVSQGHWFYSGKGVKRSQIAKDAEMNRLMDLVEKGQIGTIYIEKFDRFGSDEHDELTSRIKDIRRCQSQVYDVTQGRFLTDNDFVSKLLNLVQVYESRGELRKIAQRTMRTKVNNLDHRGQWPSGAAPFGYGKACYSQDDTLLWTWQPTSRTRGQHYIVKNGKLIPGQGDIQVPPRNRTGSNKPYMSLIPHTNKTFVKTVKLIFEMFTTQNISCRSLAKKINAAGRKYYDKPFNHSLVMQILRNPAYMGHTHFGKSQSGNYFTVGPDRLLIDFDQEEQQQSGLRPERRQRKVEERVVKNDTHEALISAKIWKKAQEKLKRIESAKRYPPRNPEYYLRPLLVCGHCGKSMSGRTEIHPSTKERTITYFCPTYLGARSKGIESKCLSYRITHDEAEKLLMDQIKQQGLEFDPTSSNEVRANLEKRLNRLEYSDTENDSLAWDLMVEGVQAFDEYLRESEVDDDTIKEYKGLAKLFYGDSQSLARGQAKRRGFDWTEFKDAVLEAEKASIKRAKSELAKLKADHKDFTLGWARADEKMKAVLKAEIDEINPKIEYWQPRAETISQRLRQLREQSKSRRTEREKLFAEWPQLENSEKGEALQRLFTNVTLFWNSTFHPSPKRPTREKKTERAGRWSHELDHDKIRWGLTDNLLGCR